MSPRAGDNVSVSKVYRSHYLRWFSLVLAALAIVVPNMPPSVFGAEVTTVLLVPLSPVLWMGFYLRTVVGPGGITVYSLRRRFLPWSTVDDVRVVPGRPPRGRGIELAVGGRTIQVPVPAVSPYGLGEDALFAAVAHIEAVRGAAAMAHDDGAP